MKYPKRVTVIELENAPFRCARDAIAYAKAHGIVGVMSDADTGGKGEISISFSSLDKMLSGSAVQKSATPALHYAALVRLRDIIRESFVAEVHPDFKKGADGRRRSGEGNGGEVRVSTMEKIATDIATFEKVIGEANGTDEPEMVRTAMPRTAMARTAAVSAAGAGQRRARYRAAVETTAVRSKAGAGQGRARYHASRRDGGGTE